MQESEETTAFRAQLMLPEQRQLFDYWLERSAGTGVPERSSISPSHFPRLLPSISLVDVADDVSQCRIRLAGTRLRDVYDREITGCLISEIIGGERQDYWTKAYQRTITKGLPSQGVVRAPRRSGDHLVQYWLKLPLRTQGKAVGMVLCLDSFLQATEESLVQRRRAFA